MSERVSKTLLTVDDVPLMRAFCHRQRYFRQAVCVAAVRAREMRMALMFRTVVGQFEVPRSLFHEGLMDQSDIEQAFERSVDCHLVESLSAGFSGDLVLAEGLARFDQDFDYGHSALGAV